MQLARPLSAIDPKRFGKARRRFFDEAESASGSARDDLTLFLTTFAAGFLVVTILIG